MRRHRASLLGIGLLVSVGLAGCVGDSTKSASDTPASTPIASVGSDTGPPVVEGQPSPPPEAGEVQARGVGLAHWQISNLYIGDFAAWATMTYVDALTGDFNGDGRMDVALLRHSPGWGSMPVALSNGDGTWRIINTYIGDFASWATEVNVIPLTGDFNGDGRTDVALVKRSAGWTTMPVAFANGDGTWRITNNSSGDFAGWAATPGVVPLTGDFNKDGRTDVALLRHSPGWKTMPVAFANGDGSWRSTNSSSGDFADWAAMTNVVQLTGDFNGDGRTDVALVRRSSGWLRMPVAFANGDGSWRITNGNSGKDFARLAAQLTVQPLTGDFNGDGRTDVALVNRKAGWTAMPVAFGNDDGTWRVTNYDSGYFAGWAASSSVQPLTGDFNGDGRTDVALVNQAVGWKSMPVAFANGDGTWRILDSSSVDFASWATQPTVLPLTGDFDGDKRTDVLLLRQSPGWGSMPVAFWHDIFLPQTTIQKSAATGLGPILHRGVEGEPATSAPTEQNNTTPAPK